MGSIKAVFNTWRHNLANNVHKQPSMQWSSGGAPVTSTTNFHIFGDLTGATECYVTAHGGAFAEDYVFDNDTFTVPAGVTVNFYQPHGYILGWDTTFLRDQQPIAHGGTDDQSYGAGETCENDMLTKDQGRHLTGDEDYADDREMNYLGSQEVAGDLGIVIVTVRNRWFHAGVTLKNAVSEVRKAAPGITTFNCLFCRVTDGYTDDKWCALNGRWE